jgi:hypothetical protein
LRELAQLVENRTAFFFAQLRQFLDDLRYAHSENVAVFQPFVRRKTSRKLRKLKLEINFKADRLNRFALRGAT